MIKLIIKNRYKILLTLLILFIIYCLYKYTGLNIVEGFYQTNDCENIDDENLNGLMLIKNPANNKYLSFDLCGGIYFSDNVKLSSLFVIDIKENSSGKLFTIRSFINDKKLICNEEVLNLNNIAQYTFTNNKDEKGTTFKIIKKNYTPILGGNNNITNIKCPKNSYVSKIGASLNINKDGIGGLEIECNDRMKTKKQVSAKNILKPRYTKISGQKCNTGDTNNLCTLNDGSWFGYPGSVDKCKQKCIDDDNCMGFTHDSTQNMCEWSKNVEASIPVEEEIIRNSTTTQGGLRQPITSEEGTMPPRSSYVPPEETMPPYTPPEETMPPYTPPEEIMPPYTPPEETMPPYTPPEESSYVPPEESSYVSPPEEIMPPGSSYMPPGNSYMPPGSSYMPPEETMPTNLASPPPQEEMMPSNIPPPQQEEMIPSNISPPQQEEMMPSNIPPPSQEEMMPSNIPPPSQEEMMPSNIPPPSQEEIMPSNIPPPSQEEMTQYYGTPEGTSWERNVDCWSFGQDECNRNRNCKYVTGYCDVKPEVWNRQNINFDNIRCWDMNMSDRNLCESNNDCKYEDYGDDFGYCENNNSQEGFQNSNEPSCYSMIYDNSYDNYGMGYGNSNRNNVNCYKKEFDRNVEYKKEIASNNNKPLSSIKNIFTNQNIIKGIGNYGSNDGMESNLECNDGTNITGLNVSLGDNISGLGLICDANDQDMMSMGLIIKHPDVNEFNDIIIGNDDYETSYSLMNNDGKYLGYDKNGNISWTSQIIGDNNLFYIVKEERNMASSVMSYFSYDYEEDTGMISLKNRFGKYLTKSRRDRLNWSSNVINNDSKFHMRDMNSFITLLKIDENNGYEEKYITSKENGGIALETNRTENNGPNNYMSYMYPTMNEPSSNQKFKLVENIKPVISNKISLVKISYNNYKEILINMDQNDNLECNNKISLNCLRKRLVGFFETNLSLKEHNIAVKEIEDTIYKRYRIKDGTIMSEEKCIEYNTEIMPPTIIPGNMYENDQICYGNGVCYPREYEMFQNYPPESYPETTYPPESYPPTTYPPESYPPTTYPPESYPPTTYPMDMGYDGKYLSGPLHKIFYIENIYWTGRIKDGNDSSYVMHNAFISSNTNTNLVSNELTLSDGSDRKINMDCLFKLELKKNTNNVYYLRCFKYKNPVYIKYEGTKLRLVNLKNIPSEFKFKKGSSQYVGAYIIELLRDKKFFKGDSYLSIDKGIDMSSQNGISEDTSIIISKTLNDKSYFYLENVNDVILLENTPNASKGFGRRRRLNVLYNFSGVGSIADNITENENMGGNYSSEMMSMDYGYSTCIDGVNIEDNLTTQNTNIYKNYRNLNGNLGVALFRKENFKGLINTNDASNNDVIDNNIYELYNIKESEHNSYILYNKSINRNLINELDSLALIFVNGNNYGAFFYVDARTNKIYNKETLENIYKEQVKIFSSINIPNNASSNNNNMMNNGIIPYFNIKNSSILFSNNYTILISYMKNKVEMKFAYSTSTKNLNELELDNDKDYIFKIMDIDSHFVGVNKSHKCSGNIIGTNNNTKNDCAINCLDDENCKFYSHGQNIVEKDGEEHRENECNLYNNCDVKIPGNETYGIYQKGQGQEIDEAFANYLEADKIKCNTEPNDANLLEVIQGGNYICKQKCDKLEDCAYISQTKDNCKLHTSCDKYSNCQVITLELPPNNNISFWDYQYGYYITKKPLNIPRYFKILQIKTINDSRTEFQGNIIGTDKIKIKKRNNTGWLNPINIKLKICSARNNNYKTYCKDGMGNNCENLLLDDMKQQYTPTRNRDVSGNMIDITENRVSSTFGVNVNLNSITEQLGNFASFTRRT